VVSSSQDWLDWQKEKDYMAGHDIVANAEHRLKQRRLCLLLPASHITHVRHSHTPVPSSHSSQS
jgi:hypothetical protein